LLTFLSSGKSLLLQSLLFDRERFQKSQFDPIAYAPQNPWLFRGTIRDNILFGTPFDQERYKNVIKCCALEPDLATFKDDDMKDVGEGGRRLSGGQRQRVALARALYSKAETALLDDVLSGLDPKTFEWIVNNCILGSQMKDRTVVLVSNNDKLLGRADMIVYMRDGTVSRTAYPTKNITAVINNEGAVHSSPVSAIGAVSESDCPERNDEPCEDNNEKSNDLDNLRGRIGFKYSKLLYFPDILAYSLAFSEQVHSIIRMSHLYCYHGRVHHLSPGYGYCFAYVALCLEPGLYWKP